MWPGTKARLKARANMIKARPYQLIRPAEMDWRRQLLHHHHGLRHLTRHHLQTLFGLRSGFNPRLKHETTVFSLAWGSGGCWVCFLTSISRPAFLTLLFSENVTFIDRGQSLFLRGFVLSCHSAKRCKSHHSSSLSCRKASWVLTDVCVSTHSLYNVHCACLKGFDSKIPNIHSTDHSSSNFCYLHKFKDESWHQYKLPRCILEQNLHVLSSKLSHLSVPPLRFNVFVWCSSVTLWNFELGNYCNIQLYLNKCFVLKMFGDMRM